MNYEKAYKEALERAKKELQTCGSTDCDAARQIFRFFPELKESEDERIRKEIINYLKSFIPHCDDELVIKSKSWIAWLEKQGDWKPSEEQMEALNAINTVGELSYVGQGDLLVKLYQDLKSL